MRSAGVEQWQISRSVELAGRDQTDVKETELRGWKGAGKQEGHGYVDGRLRKCSEPLKTNGIQVRGLNQSAEEQKSIFNIRNPSEEIPTLPFA